MTEKDFEALRFGIHEWKRVAPYLLCEFYTLTPWHKESDKNGFTAYCFYDPEKESVYLEAKAKMQRGSGYNCARFYKEAIAILETIRDYKDALKLIDECNEKAGKLTEN